MGINVRDKNKEKKEKKESRNSSVCQNARKKSRKLSKMKKFFEKTEKFSKRVFTNGILCGKLWENVKRERGNPFFFVDF